MLHDLAIDIPIRQTAAPLPAEDIRAALVWRIPTYRLLSAVFLEEPSVEFLNALRSPESLAALAEAGLDLGEDFLAPEAAALADALAVEYTSLFGASGGFPPIESVRLTGRLKQEPHFDVCQSYRRFGFEAGKTRFVVFEDQLGVELAFVAEMLERCRAALDSDDGTEYRRLEREVKRFWSVHLGTWVRGYACLVQRAAEHSLYREMARVLEAFAEDEIAGLGLRVEDLDQARAVVPKSEIQVAFNPDEAVCNACASAPPSAPARAEGSHHAA